MTNMRTLMLLTAGLGAVALVGCGADVPKNPSWQNDVYPIMVARCARCHDATLGENDPTSGANRRAIGDFSHASFDDFSDTDKTYLGVAPMYIESGVPAAKVMPPPPAAKLADWQIETIKNFVTANGLAPPPQ